MGVREYDPSPYGSAPRGCSEAREAVSLHEGEALFEHGGGRVEVRQRRFGAQRERRGCPCSLANPDAWKAEIEKEAEVQDDLRYCGVHNF